MKSMTGFASVKGDIISGNLDCDDGAGLQCGIEIRAINSRFLDCSVRLPREFGFLEPRKSRSNPYL